MSVSAPADVHDLTTGVQFLVSSVNRWGTYLLALTAIGPSMVERLQQ